MSNLCPNSPDEKHNFVRVEDETLPDGRINFAVIPGKYCLHCDRRQEPINHQKSPEEIKRLNKWVREYPLAASGNWAG